MARRHVPAGMPTLDLQRPRRLLPLWLPIALPLFIGVALGLAAMALINSFTELRCQRSDDRVTRGQCTLERGSLAFAYTEHFFVRDLTHATVEAASSEVAYRAQDGASERVYVWAGGEPLRIIDNDTWTHEERLAQAARINAFVKDDAVPALVVRYDRRLSLLLKAFAAGVLLGVPFGWRRWRKSRLTTDEVAAG